jgi:hypothetical protein
MTVDEGTDLSCKDQQLERPKVCSAKRLSGERGAGNGEWEGEAKSEGNQEKGD